MDKCELNVVGLSEVRWPGKGEIVRGNYTMFYSGGVKAEKGVAVMLRNDVVKRLTKLEYYSDRLMFVKINAKPVDNVVIATKGLQDSTTDITAGTTVENKGKLILPHLVHTYPSPQSNFQVFQFVVMTHL